MIPVYDADGIQIFNAHVLDGLRALSGGTVQCVVTSPPYWGLRAYGTNPQIWEGDAPLCAEGNHEWRDASWKNPNASGGGQGHDKGKQRTNRGSYVADYKERKIGSDVCARCGAWKGELGSEPTPELFVAHLVQIFREVRRVLREDGGAWVNLGNSYAAAGGHTKHGRSARVGNTVTDVGLLGKQTVPEGYKAKDLILIPHLFALAMQNDGWYLRNDVPWFKPNVMPSSASDRLTNSHEHVFLFSKRKRYFYDVDALRVAQPSATEKKYALGFGAPDKKNGLVESGKWHTGKNGRNNLSGEMEFNPAGRQLRTKDFFDAGLDALIEAERAYLAHLEEVRANGGVLLDRAGNVDAFVISTHSYKGSHFATFPLKLVKPMLQLSTSAGGCCARCGKPYRRVVRESKVKMHGDERVSGGDVTDSGNGCWAKNCGCDEETAVSCVVMDIFHGAGTTMLAARELGLRYVGLELNREYVDLSVKRMGEAK